MKPTIYGGFAEIQAALRAKTGRKVPAHFDARLMKALTTSESRDLDTLRRAVRALEEGGRDRGWQVGHGVYIDRRYCPPTS